MTSERWKFDMIYLKEKVYAVGGSGGSNSMDIFDSTTRTWAKQSIPFSVSHHCISQLSANQFILIAGANDPDAGSATAYLSTPGFLWSQHPKGCLSFWYDIKVRLVE